MIALPALNKEIFLFVCGLFFFFFFFFFFSNVSGNRLKGGCCAMRQTKTYSLRNVAEKGN